MTRPAPTAGTVLAYAVLDATRPLPLAVIPDLPDANLETREVAGLLVIHSRLAPQPAAPDLEHLQTFYKVIERLHAHHDILPLRWGQHFPHPQALARAITADADGYKRQLARLAGATEMGIRLLAADTQSTPERVPRHPPAPLAAPSWSSAGPATGWMRPCRSNNGESKKPVVNPLPACSTRSRAKRRKTPTLG